MPNEKERIEQIKARLKALDEGKGNYCAQWAAMHAVQGHAVADLGFLLGLLPQEAKMKEGTDG